ncbi:MAG: RecQ family ATP-dependent DNA helicase [Prevotellaceae bacterium]|nr:RecQ family ATP-dependent DNA helicase [Prevotellaceae bacterium]
MRPDYLALLKRYWGYDAFRGIQEEIIRSIGEDRDTLGLMPTGGGKSITFQLPALAREGLCIVITPLIALMKDQVENLRKRGIRALAIHSGMDRQEIVRVLDNCIFGDYKFLYLSPERLDTELFRAKLPKMHVSLITVDESHCISQWGYDFRPAYLKIAGIRDLLPGVPILALTATATPEVAKDIQTRLRFQGENLFRMSFERKNLAYIVRRTENKTGELLHILRRIQGSAIVYVRNRRRTKEVTELLLGEGITAAFYHAGLEDGVKEQRQRAWRAGEVRVMVATNAFGMGIDKPDVRVVVHIDLPDAVEAYFQEAGRAGRDGEKAYAIMLYAKSDKATLHKRVPDNFPDKEYIKTIYEHLQYYYQMAMGDGQDCVREFNIEDFCRKFKHPPLPTDSALKILTQAGYIEYTGEQENASRLLFTLRRDELYKLHGMGEDTERLIQIILRSYTGLFTDYAFINEDSLALRTGLSCREVYEKLVALSRLRIVDYIPRKKIPYIIYTRARVETDSIRIPFDIYEGRKERYVRRIDAILDYATNDTVCRSRLLLHYFGEKNGHDCGMCDTCLGRKRDTAPLLPAVELCRLIKEQLAAAPLTPAALAERLDVDKERLVDVLHELLDAGQLVTVNGLLQVP